jgi:hypothetical protein
VLADAVADAQKRARTRAVASKPRDRVAVRVARVERRYSVRARVRI